MGCFLLGGRNSQPYRQTLQGTGVREGCVELMFKILDQGAAFHPAAEYFISEPASRETGARAFILLVARC
ncbi:hypothetical protein P692DRAFT_20831567 [Suillus brevipes Sb2]|jgi:hypothetical protein|nr:hypothetical protein P692DRAFT_20831567 [Suillus brevipes Sb2]